jgi:hypothetical protein
MNVSKTLVLARSARLCKSNLVCASASLATCRFFFIMVVSYPLLQRRPRTPNFLQAIHLTTRVISIPALVVAAQALMAVVIARILSVSQELNQVLQVDPALSGIGAPATAVHPIPPIPLV